MVLEAAGSTAEAAWFDVATVGNLPLTEVTRDAVGRLVAETAHG